MLRRGAEHGAARVVDLAAQPDAVCDEVDVQVVGVLVRAGYSLVFAMCILFANNRTMFNRSPVRSFVAFCGAIHNYRSFVHGMRGSGLRGFVPQKLLVFGPHLLDTLFGTE